MEYLLESILKEDLGRGIEKREENERKGQYLVTFISIFEKWEDGGQKILQNMLT